MSVAVLGRGPSVAACVVWLLDHVVQVYFLVDLLLDCSSVIESGVLKPPPTIVDLSISPFDSSSLHFLCLWASCVRLLCVCLLCLLDGFIS